MARRSVQTTIKVTREKRVEFSAEELRKRLRLPDNAALFAVVPDGPVQGNQLPDVGIVATWTTTSEPRKEGSA